MELSGLVCGCTTGSQSNILRDYDMKNKCMKMFSNIRLIGIVGFVMVGCGKTPSISDSSLKSSAG